jgi:hypothetical protein
VPVCMPAAKAVTACDFMEPSIAENRRRHEGLGNVDFLVADVTELQQVCAPGDEKFSSDSADASSAKSADACHYAKISRWIWLAHLRLGSPTSYSSSSSSKQCECITCSCPFMQTLLQMKPRTV